MRGSWAGMACRASATSLERFFDPDYYRGKVPVFDPAIFHTPPQYDDATTPEPARGRPPGRALRPIRCASTAAPRRADDDARRTPHGGDLVRHAARLPPHRHEGRHPLGAPQARCTASSLA